MSCGLALALVGWVLVKVAQWIVWKTLARNARRARKFDPIPEPTVEELLRGLDQCVKCRGISSPPFQKCVCRGAE